MTPTYPDWDRPCTPSMAPGTRRSRVARHIARVRHGVLDVARPALRAIVSTRPGLAALNRMHRALSLPQKRRFYYAFVDQAYPLEGQWTTACGGRTIRLPLHRRFAQAWETAISFDGQDIEIHDFYERLLRSPRRPRVVFDVGAHYGLHSLKFLAHGVRTISFEPNEACHAYVRECAALNGLECEIQALALADRADRTELWVPTYQTCQAALRREAAARFGDRPDIQRVTVQQVSLDSFIETHGVEPDFLKIDTEGSELAILRGATAMLRRRPPLILFESWRGRSDRVDIFGLLDGFDYRLHELTYPLVDARDGLGREQFRDSAATNFLAFPPHDQVRELPRR